MDEQYKQVNQPQNTPSPIDTANKIARIRQEMEELREVLESKQKKKRNGGNFGSNSSPV
ncbi:hypothetical protein ACT7C8_17395 [Bacillus cereus]